MKKDSALVYLHFFCLFFLFSLIAKYIAYKSWIAHTLNCTGKQKKKPPILYCQRLLLAEIICTVSLPRQSIGPTY